MQQTHLLQIKEIEMFVVIAGARKRLSETALQRKEKVKEVLSSIAVGYEPAHESQEEADEFPVSRKQDFKESLNILDLFNCRK